jgi:alginate O-acetyltransferase complex protein AlgI
MLFNSAEFLFLFLPVTFALFFLLGRFGGRAAISVLGVSSLVFYAYWDVRFLPVLLVSVVVNFGIGRLICHYRAHARKILALGIVFNLGLLGFYKYADFFLGTLSAATGSDVPLLGVILPLGISFFTFTQIAFLVDTSRGEAEEPGFAKYLLFVTYFPHLIAGPILHHKQMMPQFGNPAVLRMRAESISVGLTLLTIGLVKKVFLADHFATYATPVFVAGGAETTPEFFEAWVGALAYTLQLYFDFSGYCDMALGLSRLFNIDLPINFNSPYKSTSIIDFWRRWHMTLSAFLRDYLYIPLGGNRHGRLRRYINLFLTMLLGGLWHGANWTFVVWGAIHGSLLVINHAWAALCERVRWLRIPAPLAVLLTFVAVVVAWVPFRAENFAVTQALWQAMFSMPVMDAHFHDTVSGVKMDSALTSILGGLLIVWFLPNSQEFMSRHWRNLAEKVAYSSRLQWQPAVWSGIIAGIIFAVAVMSLGRVSEFLYFQF